ncbi:MAG: hypothetical protein WCS31_06370 [Verrucomicrobiae bacterium]
MVTTLDQVERVALELPCSDRAKLAERLWESVPASPGSAVVMTRELESLLDEGLEHLDRSQTTDSLRKTP